MDFSGKIDAVEMINLNAIPIPIQIPIQIPYFLFFSNTFKNST